MTNGSDRNSRQPDNRRRRGRMPARRRVCNFCVDKVDHIDYKQVDVLKRNLSERGQIRARRKSGLCAKHQRRLARAVKRARYMALLPYTGEHIRIFGK